MENRILVLNDEPVFEDRLLALFHALEEIEVRVVRTIAEAVQVLIAENFDGFIVEGEAVTASEAATVARQHFPSLRILCAPYEKMDAEALKNASQQQVVIADRAGARQRRQVLEFVHSLDAQKTVSAEGIDPCHSLIGNLSQFSAAEILQMACLSQRTGRFTFKSKRGNSEIFLHYGAVRHAVYGDLEGEEAVGEIFRWRQGRFYFEEGIISHMQSVDRPWAHLLIDNLQKLDETLDIATIAPQQ
ncbi:MAG: DUF4388 domain-containing protein [Verrucomicrobiota bacterium]